MVHLEHTASSAKFFERKIPRRRLPISYASLKWQIAALDAVILVVSSIAAGVAYQQIAVPSSVPEIEVLAGIGVLAAAFYILVSRAFGHYEFQCLLDPGLCLARIIGSWALSILLLSLVLFLLKVGESSSRGAVVSFALFGAVAIAFERAMMGAFLKRALKDETLTGRRAVVAGEADELHALTSRKLFARYGLMEVGRITLRNKLEREELEALLTLTRSRSAEEIVLALNWENKEQLAAVRHHLRLSPLPVRLLPDRTVSSLLNLSGAINPYFAIELQRDPLAMSERAIKRVFDIVASMLLLAALSPLLLITALAIKLDSNGPVIFRQKRNGFNGSQFLIYKFRTMSVLEDGATIQQAKKDDVRVTRIGRVLRQTSIDELPQLINVLKGHMSLVGPRPHALAHDSEYGKSIAAYAFRQHVKPGITGWAQVNGFRGETSSIERMEQRVEHDLWYINNWSFWLDLRVVLRSCFVLLGHNNAY
jgi:undecaprenyl-phosphate galactose phosphotransferase/putative colanic acid biosynthesis UDP-glucose lipid carrier transferase